MKKIILNLSVLLLVASVALAAGIQGEVVEVKGDEIRIEVFGDGSGRLTAGTHVRLELVPKGVATLDMLKG